MKLRTLTLPCAAAALVACASTAPTTTTATTTPAVTEPAPAPAVDEARLRQALASPLRTDEERQRDQYRHPVETLSFFGVRPDHHVIELSPGGGWYTKVLGPYLAEKGKLVAVTGDPNGKPGYQRDGAVKLRELLAANPDAFRTTSASVMVLLPEPRFELGPDGSADVVLTFRNVHNWAKADRLDAVLAAAFKVLKPGGILGVVDHRAGEATPLAKAMEGGYVPEAWVVSKVQAAGFKLVEKSEVNANPKDTKDHPNGVWSLPPTLEGKDVDRDKYLAIGESDRMTLKFQKPL